MEEHSIYVEWAWKTLNEYFYEGKLPDIGENLPEALKGKAGCFVTLHKNDGSLRGCIGTIIPTKETLAEEIRDNAIASATRDPRFPAVRKEELKELIISVDVLGEPEEATIEKLNPKEYGVIVEKGWRKGVLLPDLEGVDTVNKQLSIALRKAGISPGEDYKIYRFKVNRHH
ncbi:MAG: AmmeMemoRadiSam system protein A [Kosmotoga sp.]|nr:MAG: AmmeMemoRadiSam system protein A [Kosmotoga sp.]